MGVYFETNSYTYIWKFLPIVDSGYLGCLNLGSRLIGTEYQEQIENYH